MKKLLMLSLFVGTTLLQGCVSKTNNDAPLPPRVDKNIGMANPADVYCTKSGGKLTAKQNSQGQYSTCTMADGQEIDSWELFRRDHPAKK
ncbi:putative hemolysin [Serratia aquatilis]|uniref:DUF333 domain-containing protein n=1 Tax=Serratia aquatilis TaxID=1737515 RepID=A0ABV6ECK5_9GAMM